MMIQHKPLLTIIVVIASTALISGCASTRFPTTGAAPEQVSPIATSSAESRDLPPIGEDGRVTTADNGGFFNSGDPGLDGQQTAATDGSFVSLDEIETITPDGRDLSGSLTVAKLLGTWTISAGIDQCRLNLTQTAKTGTDRYRASAPGCAIPALSQVASWQLAGGQVQLYNEAGAIIGSLLKTGNRFVGTLSGGIAVSMTG